LGPIGTSKLSIMLGTQEKARQRELAGVIGDEANQAALAARTAFTILRLAPWGGSIFMKQPEIPGSSLRIMNRDRGW
jgi:hypothetical protein